MSETKPTDPETKERLESELASMRHTLLRCTLFEHSMVELWDNHEQYLESGDEASLLMNGRFVERMQELLLDLGYTRADDRTWRKLK